MPLLEPALTTPSGIGPFGNDICEIVNQHAELINTTLTNVEWTSQGVFDLTFSDGSTGNNNVPFVPDYVTSGLLLSLQAVPTANIVDYTAGTYQIDAQTYTIAAPGTLAVNAGHPTLDRIDIIYLTTSNTIVYLAGTAATEPVPPTPPAGVLVIAEVGVTAAATAATGGYTLQAIQFFKSNVSQGFLDNQTLRWNNTLKRWVPNSQFRVSGAGFVGIQGAPDTISTLRVAGTAASILIENIAGDPIPSTNRLYAKAGNIYWNGVQLNAGTVANGSVANSTLRWDPTVGMSGAWVENDRFKTFDVANNFGASTGTSFGTGTFNTVFGDLAIQTLTTGNNNTGIGYQALRNTNAGDRNTAIGTNAAVSLTGNNADDNVAVGYNALSATVTGFQNVAIGSSSLPTSSGTGNVGVGFETLPSVTTGERNIAMGKGAGAGLTIGNRNILIGENRAAANASNSAVIGYGYNAVPGSGAQALLSGQFIIGGDDSFYSHFYIGRGLMNPNSASDVIIELTKHSGTDKSGGNLTIRSGESTGAGDAGYIELQTSDGGGAGSTGNAFITKLRIDQTTTYLNNGQRIKFTTDNSVIVNLTEDQYVYLLDSTAAAITVIPPSSPDPGTTWIIKDSTGKAFGNNITINPAGAVTIDGAATYVMNADYESVQIIFNGTEYNVL